MNKVAAALAATILALAALPALASTARQVWIVELPFAPFTRATNSDVRPHLRLRSAEGRAALTRIEHRRDAVLAQIDTLLDRPVQVVHAYRFSTVGFALRLTEDEALAVGELADVARITPDFTQTVPTHDAIDLARHALTVARNQGSDPVADLTGASAIWNGSATNDDGHLGEGMVVGVVGLGINGDHPSFAAVGDDGYEHTNPYGEDVYVGECFATPALTCNSKLIGRWNLSEGDATSEDTQGYGTLVAGLAAGNRLTDGLADLGVDLVAGLAPHANVIAYRICNPLCPSSATIAAFEQAIADGVDVLLHTVGSPPTSPWEDPRSAAALELHAAGVALAYTTGANGPAPGSMSLSLAAPWVATFVTTTHDRDIGAKTLADFAGGDSSPPNVMRGRSLSGSVVAPIVYAGDFPNPNAPGSDPALCLQPYPADTFRGQIVVCDRGQIGRILKSMNVAAGGAGGFVLANVAGGEQLVFSDNHAVPGVHIDVADAQSLREWLATGSGHTARIGFAPDANDPSLADLISASSSRGPNLGLSYLAPTAAAPALKVLGPGLGDSIVLSSARGSAPGAGALALLKSVYPQWSTAQLMSALVTTANANVLEEDQATPTGPLDHGGGRIDLAAAVNAGLLLDVTRDAFLAADPAQGGQPENLNLPGLVNLSCIGQCTWTRQVQATRNGSWRVSTSMDNSNLTLSVTPEAFSLQAGEQQTISITLTAPAPLPDADYIGAVVLEPQSDFAAPTRLPVAVRLFADTDLDGIANAIDNCLNQSNAAQRDTDGDGYGNACDADLNNDCTVNALDLGLFRNSYLASGNLDADLDGDQTVDDNDLSLLRALFLTAPGPSASGDCPL